MNKKYNNRFTLRTADGRERSSENSKIERIGAMMGMVHENGKAALGTGEGRGKNEKALKTKAANNSPSFSKKRPNPYSTNSTYNTPKITRSNQDALKRNNKQKKQFNRKTEPMKVKPVESKMERVVRSTLKTDDRRPRVQTANNNEKYDESKRKTEITSLLLRSKSAKKVKGEDDAGDKMEENKESGDLHEDLYEYVSIETPGFPSESNEDIINNSVYTEASTDDALKFKYWDEVCKIADEELKKSTDLVELMRNWSEGGMDINPEQIISELREKASINPNITSEDLEAIFQDTIKEINLNDLNSRSKYTMIDPPMELEKSISESLETYNPVEQEDFFSDDDCSISLHTLPQTLSESILILNRSSSVNLQENTYYIHERSSNEETAFDAFFSNLESDVQPCDCSSDNDHVKTETEVAATVNYFNSDNDDAVREWKCSATMINNESDDGDSQKQLEKDHREICTRNLEDSDNDDAFREWKRSATMINNESDDGDSQEQLEKDNSETCTRNLEDSDNDSSEMDDDKLFLTSAVSEDSPDGSSNDVAHVKVETEEHSDFAETTALNTPGHDGKSYLGDESVNIPKTQSSEVVHADTNSNEANYETEGLDRKSQLLSKTSKEVFGAMRSSEEVFFDRDISGHTIMYKKLSSQVGYQVNINIETDHMKHGMSSESIACNLLVDNIHIKNSEPLVSKESMESIDETSDSEADLPTPLEDAPDATNITNVVECINEEFIHMLINEYDEVDLEVSDEVDLEELDSLVDSESIIEISTSAEDFIEEKSSRDVSDVNIPNAQLDAQISKIFGNGAEVIRKSSLPSLLGVSVAMFIAAVGVIYFWHNASGIIQ